MISIHYKKSYTYISCPVIIFITLILFIIINNISEDILSLKLSRKADSFLCELTSLAPHEEGLLGRSPEEVMKAKSLHILIDVSAGPDAVPPALAWWGEKEKKKREASLPKAGKTHSETSEMGQKFCLSRNWSLWSFMSGEVRLGTGALDLIKGKGNPWAMLVIA